MLKMSIKNHTRTREGWEILKIVHEPSGDQMTITFESTSPVMLRTTVEGPKSMRVWRVPPKGVRVPEDESKKREEDRPSRPDNWGNK